MEKIAEQMNAVLIFEKLHLLRKLKFRISNSLAVLLLLLLLIFILCWYVHSKN